MTRQQLPQLLPAVLTENAADAGLPPRPDVLDGVGQVLLLRTSGRSCRSSTTRVDWALGGVRPVHQPGQGRAGHARTTSTPSWPRSAASFEDALRQLRGRRRPPRGPGQPRAAARGPRAPTPASAPTSAPRRAARRPTTTPDAAEKAADREARRTIAGTGHAHAPRPVRARRPAARSTPSPRPTSSTAPPSRSCA